MNATKRLDLNRLQRASVAARFGIAPAVVAGVLSGCASPEAPLIAPPLMTKSTSAVAVSSSGGGGADGAKGIQVVDTPPIPAPKRESTVKAAVPAAAEGAADTSLMFDGLPLPSFVQVVFGSVLKKNYSIDPVVLSRTDLVTIRTGPQTAAQTLDTTRMLLKTYGLAVTELGGFYRIAPDNNLNAYSPEIRRGRAQPEVPLPLRPVFQLVEMTSVKAVEVSGWLKTMFGQKIAIQEDPSRNALLLNGQPADMVAALEALQVLDQPLMRGRRSKLLTPSALSSEDLARKLAEILSTEGYAVSVGSGTQSAISLITIPASNSVLVFTVDEAVLQHVISWSQKLEALDNDSRRVGSYFSYTVKYADAQSLAKTLQELLSTPAQTAAPGAIGVTPKAPGRIVVNGATNTLIFTSTQSEYQQLLSILRELDQPSKSALIEVTVAEVRVSDTSQLGIEWALPSGNRVVGGTKGGLGIGTGGLTLNYLSNAGVVKAQLNALAAASKANILSTPRIMARNGETAMIQVGQEVPIVTSQQSNANSGVVGGSNGTVATGILQTIQYKNTGVILKVKPVIFSGDRIELDVSQEVSSAAATSTGVTTSPTISTRKVETKLSIKDGATWLLGGLMSSSDTKTDSGIPLLKDIPIAGQLFRTNTGSVDKTELIVLITPYIINDDNVAEQLTQSFRSQLGGWAQAQPATAQKQSDGRAVATSGPDVGVPNAASQPASQPQAPAVEAPVPAAVAPGTDKGGSSPNEPEAPSKAPAADSVPAASADLGAILSGSNSTPVTDPKLLDEFKRAQSGPAMTEHVVPVGVATVPSSKGAAKPVPKKTKQPVKPGVAASSASR